MKRLAIFTTALFGLCSAAAAKPVSANITLQNDSQFACYIVSADATNIRYSLDESGAGVSVIPMAQVKVLITRPPEEWTEAEATYNSGDFATAETQFKKLAEEYAPIAALQDEYGSLAKFYYLQTLKKNGKLDLLADEIETMRTQTIALSKIYRENAQWLVPWGYIGKKKWDDLLTFVAAFADTEGQKDNPNVPFKKGVPSSRAAELSYFRAIATENTAGAKEATQDYYRAMTLSNGGDRQIAQKSILALLNTTLAAENEAESYFNKTELHSLAILYKQVFGDTDLPAQYVGYLTPPPPPPSSAPPSEPEKEKPAEGETPPAGETEPADGTKPDDATKPAEPKEPAEEKPAGE